MIEVSVLNKSPLYDIKKAMCATQGKKPKTENISREFNAYMAKSLELGRDVAPGWNLTDLEEDLKSFEEIKAFYIKQFICRHSTCEVLFFSVFSDECRGDVASHLVRSTNGHPRHFVQSKRPDWNNGEKRKPLDQEIKFYMSVWTPASWMEMCYKRLCFKAAKQTRQWVINVIKEMLKSPEPMFQALAVCSVPQCVRFYACPELQGCGWRDKTFKELMKGLGDPELWERYQVYAEWLKNEINGKQ